MLVLRNVINTRPIIDEITKYRERWRDQVDRVNEDNWAKIKRKVKEALRR